MNIEYDASLYLTQGDKSPFERYLKRIKSLPEAVDILNHIDFLLENRIKLAYPNIKPIWKKCMNCDLKQLVANKEFFILCTPGAK